MSGGPVVHTGLLRVLIQQLGVSGNPVVSLSQLCATGLGDSAYFYVQMIFYLNGLLASAIGLLGTYLR